MESLSTENARFILSKLIIQFYSLNTKIINLVIFHFFFLQKNPKLEFSQPELLKLLSYLEGELQARDVVIAALKVNFI